MTTRRTATCCGVGLPSGYAVANRKRGPRTAGMRPSVIADSRRHGGNKVNHLKDDEANA